MFTPILLDCFFLENVYSKVDLRQMMKIERAANNSFKDFPKDLNRKPIGKHYWFVGNSIQLLMLERLQINYFNMDPRKL